MPDGYDGRAAERLAKDQKAVSVSEFFERNRHLLGYDNPTRALITVVKELVDNSLDACEEARILPRIWVEVKPTTANRFRVMIKDNGPGVVDKQIPMVFGKLLYGSKFFKLVQSRGQQGIGASGSILYSQLTTGKPTKIVSSTGNGKTSFYDLAINIKKNEPDTVSHRLVSDGRKWHGLKIEMEIEGRYLEGRRSVTEYIKETAIANPYAEIMFDGPNEKIEFPRGASVLPPSPKSIKPHPYGIELGILRRMLSETKTRTIVSFLSTDFSRVGQGTAKQICELAGVNGKVSPKRLDRDDSEKLFMAMQKAKLVRPPTNCLSPLGEKLMLKGLKKELDAEFFATVTRPPTVYRGNPFQIEVGIAYGGELPPEGSVDVLRLSNKVPLLYMDGDCAITKAITSTDWRRYGLSQSGRSTPTGPALVLVHFASVWVPFTSEAKQAISAYPIIMKEIKLALQEAGRKLQRFVSGKRRLELKQKRRKIFERYIPEVAESVSSLTGKKNKPVVEKKLKKMLYKKVGVSEKVKEDGKEKDK